MVCITTQLNSDSSVYLSDCTVSGRDIDYIYGSDKTPTYEAYEVGNQVTYNNIKYYVIKDSGVKESIVTLLKAEPLTVDEVNLYGGVGTINNHVNVYATQDTSSPYYQKANNYNGYGEMRYYSSSTCNSDGISGCTTNYELSDVKYVVDKWAITNAADEYLKTSRLLNKSDLFDNLGYDENNIIYGSYISVSSKNSKWLYNSNYWYWLMVPNEYFNIDVWVITSDGHINTMSGIGNLLVVRPVIELYKNDDILKQ